MNDNKNGIIEAIGGLKMLLHDFEKKATPRVPFKAMRHALATAIKCCEKQIPKKPKETIVGVYCSECKHFLDGTEYYCSFCGQKLDWGD